MATGTPSEIIAEHGWRVRDEAQPDWAHELEVCMEYNKGPFEFGDISEAILLETDREPESYGHLGEGEWEWWVRLTDGREFNIKAWHDYTGWDCQSSAEYTESNLASEEPDSE